MKFEIFLIQMKILYNDCIESFNLVHYIKNTGSMKYYFSHCTYRKNKRILVGVYLGLGI